MSGGEPIDYDEAGSVEDLDPVEDPGPVGSWRLPAVFHRITRPAWLFIWLAIASLVADLSRLSVPDIVDGSSPIGLMSILGYVARSAPVLLPAAILWSSDRPRLRWSDPLVAGSVAIALSTLLGNLVSRVSDLQDSGVFVTSSVPIVTATRLVLVALAIAGPLLMASAILRLRTDPVSRPLIRVGLAIAILAIATAFMTLNQSTTVLLGGDDTIIDQTFDDYVRSQALLGLFASFGFIAQAVFAWAVISFGPGSSRQTPWLFAAAAVGLEQLLLAQNLLLVLVFRLSPDAGVAIQGVTLQTLSGLSSVASILLVAAFAMGFGRSDLDADADAPAADAGPPNREPKVAD